MPDATIADPGEESLARLAAAWLAPSVPGDTRSAAERAGVIVDAAKAGEDFRPAWLSQAFEAVTLVSAWHDMRPMPERLAGARRAREALRECPFARARWLAEAAAALLGFYDDETTAELVALLRLQPTAGPAAAPAVERFWTEAALCRRLADTDDTEGALMHGLAAESLARTSPVPGLDSVIGHLLAYLFLRLGDCEAAQTMGERAVASTLQRGRQIPWLHYNLQLARHLAGRVDEVVAHFDAHPWLLEPATLAGASGLRPLAAAAWAASGRTAQAQALLDADDACAGAATADDPNIAANRAWLLASVELRADDAAPARRRIEAAQAALSDAGVSPMNETQLNLALSRACEELGDAKAALAALKRSQTSCVNWVGQSMLARMQLLQSASAAPAEPRHEQRIQTLNAAVQRARAESAERALDERSRYFAKVMHEIRNPVSGLIGMTSLLTLSALDDGQRRYVALAQSSAQTLLTLCNDVLDLATIESGHFKLQPRATDVRVLTAEVVELFSAQAKLRGLRLACQLDASLPAWLQVDPVRLRQVLTNLVVNALKFTREGSVTVRVRWSTAMQDHGTLAIDVVDSGPGISPEQQRKVFDEFARGDDATAARSAGTGLGLAVCRQLIGQMGGAMHLSTELGRGSTFTIELPAALASPSDNGVAVLS